MIAKDEINKSSLSEIADQRFRPYPGYKNSGVEWLGEIPAHWQVKRLKHVMKCLDGRRIPLNSEERGRMQGRYPYWGANGIVDYIDSWLFDEDLVLLGEDGAPFFEPNKDVAFFVTGKIWVNNHAHVIRATNGAQPKFLAYCLNTVDYRAFIDGSTRDKLTQGDMTEIPVQLPLENEQRAIAEFLDRETAKIDAMVAKKERLIELLQEKRTSLITRAVTKGHDPNVPMKDSGIEWLGEIPAHWTNTRFGTYCRLQQGLQIAQSERHPMPSDDLHEYITVKSIHAGEDRPNKEFVKVMTARVLCNPDDVLLARTGATGEVLTGLNGAFHNNFFKIVFDRRHVVKEFLVFYLSSSLIRQHLLLLAGTTTIPDLNHGDFLSSPFLLPSSSEQRTIISNLTEKTTAINRLASKVATSIDRLKEHRIALITAAVTGKIDVRGSVAESNENNARAVVD